MTIFFFIYGFAVTVLSLAGVYYVVKQEKPAKTNNGVSLADSELDCPKDASGPNRQLSHGPQTKQQV
jgi:hypothetical protein